jgi:hypothetical protein
MKMVAATAASTSPGVVTGAVVMLVLGVVVLAAVIAAVLRAVAGRNFGSFFVAVAATLVLMLVGPMATDTVLDGPAQAKAAIVALVAALGVGVALVTRVFRATSAYRTE